MGGKSADDSDVKSGRHAQPTAGWAMRWLDRLYAQRNRLLSSPAFQKWAASFPLTRPIARQRAQAAFDLCAGFVYSQILLACIRLRVFEILDRQPQTAAELAPQLALTVDATNRLLAAATSLGLAERRSHGRFGLGVRGAAFIGNPSIGAMVQHHAMFYADLADPVALLRAPKGATQLARYWAYAGSDAPTSLGNSDVAAYSTLMAASQELIAGDILDAYAFAGHTCLMDVGGGEGAFLTAVAARHAGLQFRLFDLPAVTDRARQRFAAAGIADRATISSGDFASDALPEGADVISLVRIVHDHDDDTVMGLLRAVHRALPAGGKLLIAEPMAGTRGAEPMGDAYFGFYLLAMGSGRPRTPVELKAMLAAAGFEDIRQIPTRRPMLTSAITATAAKLPNK